MASVRRAVCMTGVAVAAAALLSTAPPSYADPVMQGKQVNQVKGQAQISGGSGVFGQVYTLRNGFNFEILSARYTMEPFVGPYPTFARTYGKVLVMDVAIKNARPRDNSFNTEHFFNLVDDKGQIYHSGNFALDSMGPKGITITLRPGQGLGQPALHDPVRVGVELPAKARIVKIMLREGRANPQEETFRYFIAGATKEEAGEAGNPKNVIAPLPDAVRDPSDPSGSTPLPEGKGTIGQFVPSGWFDLRLDSFAFTDDAVIGSKPHKGKRFAVATVTAKSRFPKEITIYDAAAANQDELTDAGGERYKRVAFLKATQPGAPDRRFNLGDEYTFRVVFETPAGASGKTLVLGTQNAYRWAYDVSSVK